MILENLRIKNFRLFEDLEFNRLGRINLLVGRNNAGKSTVLEALRIYAKVGSPKLLQELLESHNETGFERFFPDNFSPEEGKTTISIGSLDQDDYLTMKYTYFILEDASTSDPGDDEKSLLRLLRRRKLEMDYQDISKYPGVRSAFKIEATNSRLNKPMVRDQLSPPGVFNVWVDYSNFDEKDYDLGNNWLKKHNITIPYRYVPTHLLSDSELKAMWNKISLTSYSKYVIEALQIIEPKVEALAFIPIDTSPEEVPFVNIGNDQLVPLRSLGEGMLRLLQLVLSMIDAKGGLLLIDEFENGLHYSVQPKVWQLLIDLATQLNVQVFATTHSWDCVTAFQEGIAQSNETESMLFHLGRSALTSDQGKVVATAYDKEELELVSQVNLEVR